MYSTGFHSAFPLFGYFQPVKLSPPQAPLFLFFVFFFPRKQHLFLGRVKLFHNIVTSERRIFPCFPRWNCENSFPAPLAVLAQLESNSSCRLLARTLLPSDDQQRVEKPQLDSLKVLRLKINSIYTFGYHAFMSSIHVTGFFEWPSFPAGQCFHTVTDEMRFPTFLSFQEFLPDVFLGLEFTLSSVHKEGWVEIRSSQRHNGLGTVWPPVAAVIYCK